jgi:hypothetical protein
MGNIWLNQPQVKTSWNFISGEVCSNVSTNGNASFHNIQYVPSFDVNGAVSIKGVYVCTFKFDANGLFSSTSAGHPLLPSVPYLLSGTLNRIAKSLCLNWDKFYAISSLINHVKIEVSYEF